jgi:hypothetical protein
MTKEISLAQKIRALKVGKSFTVSTEKERQKACRIAKTLREACAIDFTVVTKRKGNVFKIAAI